MTNQKLGEIEKKMHTMSLDKFMNELQNLRDGLEQIRQIANGADKKTKEMKKQIDSAVKKDEVTIMINENVNKVKDDLLAIIKSLEDKLK